MKNPLRSSFWAVAATALALPLFAHHPFDPEFDWTKPVKMTGTVTKVEYANPHVTFDIAVKEAKGTVEWQVELGSTGMLAKFGWSEKTLKAGDQIVVDGWLARQGVKEVSARTVTLPTGAVLFGASSFFDMPYRMSHGKVGICISSETCIEMEKEITRR